MEIYLRPVKGPKRNKHLPAALLGLARKMRPANRI
jgi:hypothetical protein